MSKDVKVNFNKSYFDQIMKKSGVAGLTKKVADSGANTARASAPVNTGQYRDGIAVERHDSKYRAVYRIEGHDRKTLLVEMMTGNLARALRRTKGAR